MDPTLFQTVDGKFMKSLSDYSAQISAINILKEGRARLEISRRAENSESSSVP